MANKEKQSLFYFPKGTDSLLLGKLEHRFTRNSSLRTTVAHRLEEEGIWLREMVDKFLPHDFEAEIAIDEYALVGTIILETESAMQSGNYKDAKFGNLRRQVTDEENQVKLLQEDPQGFGLLKWRFDSFCKNYGNMNQKERQVALIGLVNGMRRYKELYTAMHSLGFPSDF